MNLTYRQLIERLNSVNEADLDKIVVIQDMERNEIMPVVNVVHDMRPVLVADSSRWI